MQVSDRWHLWLYLCDKIQLEVRAHADCWATSTRPAPAESSPYDNGRTEGVNTRTKRITRLMHGRAGFDLFRYRVLLR